ARSLRSRKAVSRRRRRRRRGGRRAAEGSHAWGGSVGRGKRARGRKATLPTSRVEGSLRAAVRWAPQRAGGRDARARGRHPAGTQVSWSRPFLSQAWTVSVQPELAGGIGMIGRLLVSARRTVLGVIPATMYVNVIGGSPSTPTWKSSPAIGPF